MLGSYPDDNGMRDAFHVACVAVTCDEQLEPGESLRFKHFGRGEVESCNKHNRHGIADPMLLDTIPAGQVFWMCVKPGSTRNLTHSFKIEDEPEAWEDEDDRIACREMGCG